MKNVISIAFAAGMLLAPALVATPAQAQTMEECLAKHSAGYCEAALGTESLNSGAKEQNPCLVLKSASSFICY